MLSGSFEVELLCELLFWKPQEVIGSDSRNINSKQSGSHKLWIKHNVSCLTIPSPLIKPWACWAIANHHTDSINWNGNMIKNPINNAALMDRKM